VSGRAAAAPSFRGAEVHHGALARKRGTRPIDGNASRSRPVGGLASSSLAVLGCSPLLPAPGLSAGIDPELRRVLPAGLTAMHAEPRDLREPVEAPVTASAPAARRWPC